MQKKWKSLNYGLHYGFVLLLHGQLNVYVYVYLSICMFVYINVRLCVCLSVRLYIALPHRQLLAVLNLPYSTWKKIAYLTPTVRQAEGGGRKDKKFRGMERSGNEVESAGGKLDDDDDDDDDVN